MRQYKRNPLSEVDKRKLENAADTFREKFIVFVLLDTGLRVSELAGLTKQEVLWQEKRLRITGKGGPFGKNSKLRVVPLTERAMRLLELFFAQYNTVREARLAKRTIQYIVKKVANKAGITQPMSAHVLRHTFAVSCIRKGMPTRIVQELLGHDHIQTTEIYLNLSPEDVDKVFRERWG